MQSKLFYNWLEANGYEVFRDSNIFRGDKFIVDFDPLEDDDSGEYEETIKKIKQLDPFNLLHLIGHKL